MKYNLYHLRMIDRADREPFYGRLSRTANSAAGELNTIHLRPAPRPRGRRDNAG